MPDHTRLHYFSDGPLALVLVFVRLDGGRSRRTTTRQGWLIGFLLAITLLARLDSVFVVFPFVAAIVTSARRAEGRGPRWWRPLLGMVIVPGVVLTVYVTTNMLLFDTATPVSGQAKSLGGPFLNLSAFGQFLSAPSMLGHSSYLGLLALVLTPVAWTRARSHGSAPVVALVDAGALLLAGSIATVGFYAVSSSWSLWWWYFAPIPVILLCSVTTLVATSKASDRQRRSVLAICLMFAVIFTGASVVRLATTDSPRTAYLRESFRIARRLRAEFPADAVVAMGDRSGALGFYLDRPLIQLEGLVGSEEYLSALRAGHVHDFLAEHRVTLYARAAQTGGAPTAIPGCYSYEEPVQGKGPVTPIIACDEDLLIDVPLPDGTSYRVWRYRPELNP